MNLSITNIFVIAISITSILAFSNNKIIFRLIDWPYRIKHNGEFYRLLSSGFIHADWLHLLINMFVFYQFGNIVEQYYQRAYVENGKLFYILLLLLGVIIPNLIGYFRNMNNPNYRGLGFSGAVSAVLFAFVVFDPWSKLYLYGIVPIYAILAAILYIAYSFWADRKRNDSVNHMAHLTGGIFGILFTILLKPELALYFLQQLKQFNL